MYSVLMSVYYKDDASHLAMALQSIVSQTLTPGEIILVEDGPLGHELRNVISKFRAEYDFIKTFPLNENQGLGNALSFGLTKCTFDLIGRMDADDISILYRFEKQVRLFIENPKLDIASSWISEFEGNPENIVSMKKLPEYHLDIISYARKRCPINHPSVMYRKAAVTKAGGYLHFPLFEDYYLWIRMIQTGCIFYNIQESLLFYRTSSQMFKRRGGWKYGLTDLRLFNMMYQSDFITWGEWLKYAPTRVISRFFPNNLRTFIYKKFLRD